MTISLNKVLFNKYLILLQPVLLLASFIFACFASVYAADQVIAIASDEVTRLQLNPYLELLEDPAGKLTIDDVTSPQYFSRFKPNLNSTSSFGFTESVYWVRVTIRNQSLLNENWLLESSPPNINLIELYKPLSDSNGYFRIKTGISMPASTRDLYHHRFVFNITLPFHKEQVFYLKFQNQSSLIINLNLWHRSDFINKNKAEYFWLGLFYGIMIFMLVYNLFLYFSLKETSYLYYVAFFSIFLCWNLLYNGIAQLYLLPDRLIIDQKIILVLLSLSAVLLMSFTKAILKLRQNIPFLVRFFSVLQVLVLLTFPVLPFVSLGIVAKFDFFIACIAIIFILVSFFLLRRKRYKPARFYFAAWSVFIAVFVVFMLDRIGVLPPTEAIDSFYKASIIWFVTMLSLALADNIKDLKDRAESAYNELHNSDMLFEAIFNQTFQLIGLLSPDGRILKVNETALNLSAVDSKKVEGIYFWAGPWWDSIELREQVKDAVKKAATGEFIRFETYHIDHQGQKRFIDFSLKPIFDEHGVVTLLIPEGRDISERRLMDDAIRESEEKYRKLVDLAQDGILVVQEGKIIFANPYMETMTGYSFYELENKEIHEFVLQDSFEEIVDTYLLEKQTGTMPGIHESLFLHKDGSERYIEYNMSPFTFQGKKAFLVFIRNIHDRKQAEIDLIESRANLETSEQRYQQLFDRSVAGMFTSKISDGTILSTNRAAKQIFGFRSNYEPSENLRFTDLYINISDRRKLIKKLFKEGVLHNEQIRLKKINGKEFWAEFSIKIFPEQDLLEGTIKDITKTKEAEEVLNRSREELNRLVNERTRQLKDSQSALLEKTRQLEQSNLKLQDAEYRTRSLLENSPDFILNVDSEGKIIYSNHSINQFDRASLAGRNIFEFTTEEHRKQLEDAITHLYKTGIADNIEISMLLKDNEPHWFEIRFAGLRYEEPISQVMIIATDITKRIQAENELVEAQKVALEKAHKAGMADIASGILHNVGNLLNSVNTSLHLIWKTIHQSSAGNLLQANEMLDQKLDNLEEFILRDPKGKLLIQYYLKLGTMLTEEQDQMLHNVNRVKQKLDLIAAVIAAQQNFATADSLTEKHTLVSIVEDVLMIHSGSMERSGVEIIKDFCDLPKILIQKAKLVHVLISLLDNATESMAEMTGNKKIIISTTKTDTEVFLKITDNGVGIPKDNLKKIFMHNFKNDNDQQCFSLHSSAIYMSEMNGSIWAESAGLNQGATFILQLPLT